MNIAIAGLVAIAVGVGYFMIVECLMPFWLYLMLVLSAFALMLAIDAKISSIEEKEENRSQNEYYDGFD